MFQNYIQKITAELSNELPGELAHLEMMHSNRKFLLDEKLDNYKPSAVLVLFYPNEEDKMCVLLIERTSYNGHHSGQIALPGGKKEKDDVDLEATALREFFEETGSNVTPEVIGKLTHVHIPLSKFMVQPVVAFANTKPLFSKSDAEVNKLIEWEIQDLINQDINQKTTIYVRYTPVVSNYFLVENKILWGATAMILNELRWILKKAIR